MHGASSLRESSEYTLMPMRDSLAEVGRAFHARGWTLGTSGTFSDPLRLLITRSGADKGRLVDDDFLELDPEEDAGEGPAPSAETRLHVTLVRERGARAVLHTHSVWSTILSDVHAGDRGLEITGYEMLKGLAGVSTHEHREWVPILENSQDMAALAGRVESVLSEHPGCHGFLLRRHGLYTWGSDLAEARRHVEILEFLMEVLGRRRGGPGEWRA
jgi:methylthioribulose-1-phosphate dehydratase